MSSPLCHLMEDHRDAYFFWKKLGVLGCTCVHVDAHLDTGELQLPGYTGTRQPEINCGNFLLHAMVEGIVRTLVWVVPPHLPQPDRVAWIQQEVQTWLHPTLSEHLSWRDCGARLEGRLRGCRVVVCRSDRLPDLDGPVLLDVDVDYFLGPDDQVWQSPLELVSHLRHLAPVALTVAYSVEGGYTPVWLRHLGDLTALAWLRPNEAPAWTRLEEPWVGAARLVAEVRDDFDHPAYRQAAELDPGYALSALDAACYHLQRNRYEACLAWLSRVEPEDPNSACYLRAFIHFSQQNFASARDCWVSLLEQPHDHQTRRHLLEMQGRTLTALGRSLEAVSAFSQAAGLAPSEARPWID
ncbi:MAG: hypothetical protein AB1758_23830, partial [Candidatus Eremiobacterota bacterium]